MRFLSSHVIHFILMGLGISDRVGMISPPPAPERTRMTILKHLGGLVGIGLVLAWVMYLLPRHPVRF